jgi:hypothetical protein
MLEFLLQQTHRDRVRTRSITSHELHLELLASLFTGEFVFRHKIFPWDTCLWEHVFCLQNADVTCEISFGVTWMVKSFASQKPRLQKLGALKWQ